VRNMIGGQYDKPLRAIAINPGEGWARDVSKRIASVIVKEAERDDRTLPRDTGAFVEAQLGRPDAVDLGPLHAATSAGRRHDLQSGGHGVTARSEPARLVWTRSLVYTKATARLLGDE
jgi:hypothetical protein